jgi:hypothetical protein
MCARGEKDAIHQVVSGYYVRARFCRCGRFLR